MLAFRDYWDKIEVLEEFDAELIEYTSLNEANLGDYELARVIGSGLDKIKTPNVRKIMGTIANIAKFSGRKVSDIVSLFSKNGVSKIKKFIDNDILGSEEIKYITRKFDENRYKGYKGFEQFIRDMKEDNPRIFDSLVKATKRIVT